MDVRVFVAGGTGVVGRRLVPQLVAQGHQVTATTTNPRKLTTLAELGAEGVVMDGLDAASVREAVAGARPDTVVHLMTAISTAHAGKPDFRHMDRWFAPTNRLRTEGTDNLLAAADATGVSHVVAQSYASWNGLRQGGWVKTEDDPLDPLGDSAAARSRERSAISRTPSSARAARSCGTAGSTGPAPRTTRSSWCASGGSRSSASGAGYCSWLHVDDAASATLLAVEQKATGVFDIVDDEPAPASAWLPYLAEAVGAKQPMRVPVWLARLLAGKVAVTMMTQGRGFSNAKAKRDLGWQLRYPSWRQGFREGLA